MGSMKKIINSQDQVFWYLNRPAVPCLRESLEADVVVIGGGMAGLSTAHAFAQKNKRVVLLEAYYCGAGASGKSSGFITPNSELSLSDFIEWFGESGGKAIWKVIEAGAEYIRTNIMQHAIDCDYIKEDSLFVAKTKSSVKKLLEEHKNLERFGYQSSYIKQEDIPKLLGSHAYYGGVTYANTFGINAYKYCQAMKAILVAQGVKIYEETPVISFKEHEVNTLHATVKADYIIVCTDRFSPTLGALSREIYHAQNFLLISQTLTEHELRSLFPDRSLMVWDTDLLYSYFRISGNRLLLGGGSLWHMYDRYEKYHNRYVYHKLTHYFKKRFPQLDIQFEQFWPGMIGISKDIAPLYGRDKDYASIYYIAATAGLPIAATLGNYCADHIVDGRDDLRDYFSPYRKYAISGFTQRILGTKLSFALSNLITLKI
jgi:gamma-glutamylputrescine oxidase